MPELKLYNSRTRRKEVFQPRDPNRVTLYVCGPTVYGPAHIGNARPAVVFDVLARLLRQLYPKLIYARNITDIDDKINARAAEEGVDISTIADRYTQKYHEDMHALGVLPPDIEPRATDYIPQMLEMIQRLCASGHAYEAEGHVLFHSPAYADYGKLSGRDMEQILAGARVEVAPYKRDPSDFVLWKPSTPDQPAWDSPYGRGRPGWHIECSAMIAKHLGDTIDIHGGGHDLQFPHHENEAAQSHCAHNAPLANFWLHNGMLKMSGEKMSKSRGNIRLVDELLAEAPSEAIRFALLQGHYRQPLDFTPALLAQSVKTLDRLYRALGDAPATEPPAQFMEALYDDLNTPRALAVLADLAKSGDGAMLKSAGAMLGILQDPENWFSYRTADVAGINESKIDGYIDAREKARDENDYKRADEIRDELLAEGIILEDTPDGTIWRRA